jgi:hypothetical protein
MASPARTELPWDHAHSGKSTPKGLRLPKLPVGATPSGLVISFEATTQGSSFLVTLGFESESLWDSLSLAFGFPAPSAICHLPSAISETP